MITAIFVGVPAAFIVTFYLYRKLYCHRYWKRRGVPGPEPHWWYGNLHQFTRDPGCRQRHLVVQAWGHKYGKLFGYYEGAKPILVISSLEAAEQVLIKQYSNFQGHYVAAIQPDPRYDIDPATGHSNSGLFSVDVLFAWGQHWKRLRAAVSPCFSTGKLKGYLAIMEKCEREMLVVLDEKSRSGHAFNIHETFQRLAIDIIGEAAFGVEVNSLRDTEGENAVVGMIQRVMKMFREVPPVMFFVQCCPELERPLKAFAKWSANHFGGGMNPWHELNQVCRDMIDKRLADPSLARRDILQTLIECREAEREPLTKDEIVAQSVVFFGAGAETTSTALAFASFLLATHQDVQEKLYAEIARHVPGPDQMPDYDLVGAIEYLDWVCKETLRLYSIGLYIVNRYCMDDTQVMGVNCPKHFGVVMIDMHSIHMDPELWGPVDPNKFYPERFATEHAELAWMPFGAGPRQCIGMRFALLEMKTALVAMMRRFKILEPPGGYPGPLPLRVELFMSPADGVSVRVVPRC